LADQATDTASAALLRKHLDEAYRLVDWLYQDRRETDVRDIAHKALKQIKEAMLLASLPAPATDSTALLKRLRFDFIDGLDGAILPEDDRRFVKECLDQAIANYVKALASLPAPAAPADPDAPYICPHCSHAGVVMPFLTLEAAGRHLDTCKNRIAAPAAPEKPPE